MKNWIKLIIALIIGFSMARVIFLIVHNSNIVDLPFIEFIYSFLNGLRYDISVIGYFTLPVLLIYIFVLFYWGNLDLNLFHHNYSSLLFWLPQTILLVLNLQFVEQVVFQTNYILKENFYLR